MILCRPNCPGIFMPDPAHSIIVAPGGVKVCPVLTRSGAHGREILAFVHPTAGHQIVKGTLEEGEALEPAALRELAEESGIDSARIMAKIAEIEVPDYCQFWHVYECETDADLAEQPRFGEHIDDLAEFFSGETTMVAHNMPFDFQMLLFELKRELREHKFPWPTHHIDTVQLAKSHYNGKYMKLQALYEDLIGPYEQKHRAVDDARMLMEVYHALMAKANGNSSKN